MSKSTRRITSGMDAKQQSKILAEDTVNWIKPYTNSPSFELQNLFYTEENPQSLTTSHLATPYNIELPQGAFRFLKVRMPTKNEMIADLKNNNQPLPEDWTKYNLHKTDSADYIYILSGKITYIVDNEQIDLNAGDFLAQIGPEHTWLNDNNEPCFLLCIMMGSKR